MAAWMKGALALVALGAVVGLALFLGSSEPGDDVSDSGVAAVTEGGSGAGDRAGMELPEGVSSEATSLAPKAVEALDVAAGSPEADPSSGNAQLASAAPQVTLKGRVVDVGGSAIANARVVFHGQSVILGRGPGRGSSEITLEAPPEVRTNAQGGFQLTVDVPSQETDENLPNFLRGGAQLAAAHEAFTTLITETPNLIEGETDLGTLVMSAGTQVVGRVVDEAGRAVADARVSGRHVDDSSRGGRGFMRFFSSRVVSQYSSFVTGTDGRFLLTGLPPGAAELTAEADGQQIGVLSDLELVLGNTQDVGDVQLLAGEMIAGYVTDGSGAPVEGAQINVSSMARIVLRSAEDMPRQQIGQEMRLRAETDVDGYFEMRGLGEGQYTVHVNADGFARSSTENIPTGTRDFSVSLSSLGELLVTVRSSTTREAIQGAVLDATVRNDRPFGWGGDAMEVLESEDVPGEYTVLGAGPTGTSLVVGAEGFATLEIDAPAVDDGGQQRFFVDLVPESVIAGQVVGADGRGIADARVRISAYTPPAVDHGHGRFQVDRQVRRRIGGGEETNPMLEATRTSTDATGAFELRGVPAGDWELTASALDFVASQPEVLSVDIGQVQDDVTIQLEVGGAVIGRVVDSDGLPVSKVTVLVSAKQPAGGGGAGDVESRLDALLGSMEGDSQERATTDADGEFEVRSLNPGLYEVQLNKQQGMRFGGAMVFVGDSVQGSGNPDDVHVTEVLAGEESFVELVQKPLSTLEGRVLAGGEPVEVVLVSLNEADSFLPFGGQQVETDRFGRFIFEDVEPGNYKLSTVVPGAALPETQEVSLESGQTANADLVFQGATLRGRVVDSESGQGAADVTITVSPVEQASEAQPQTNMSFQVVMVESSGGGRGGGGMSMQMGGGPQSKVRTNANGDFEVRFLKPGRYGVETLGGAYVQGEAGPFEVEEGRTLDDITIEVDRGASITGMVVSGETGQPLSGAPVALQSAGSNEMTMAEDGRFSFEGLDAGDYTIEVMGSGFGGPPVASQAVTLEVGELRELDLTTDG